ncbi:phosphotransferase [Kitasatospora sp. MAP5-34]|uniref:phosphotransferase enzyme family protein n=1 Tax=Kitasatospora sp. MAP5-34 TaxID=3035102 RepID=UPI0024732D55|nr:phosphotransferase [Kitasatospora sp. MAP5-34]MDH6578651.1 Ser/Thr protein kinase RdoA (MazF antagonist) [Kitasatospora sp. MAP5-34]
MPSFSLLPHATQLEQLERLTRAALSEHYGIDGDAVMEVQQYEDNAVWRVTPPGSNDSYVARLSVRDGRPAHQQVSEMRWLESLAHAHTVAVPVPVPAADGYVVPVAVPGHDELSTLAVLRWLPGTAEPPYRRPGVAVEMGRAAAHLHQHAATVPLIDFDRPVWNAQTILQQGHALATTQGHDQLGADGTRVLRTIAELITPALQEGSPTDRGRIHGDLHRENMIALPDGSGVGIIDFDDCGTGHYLLDIATVLSSIHRIARQEPGAYEDFARAFLAGYTAVRPLPADTSRLLEPYLLLRDAFVLNFVTTAIPVNADVASWGPGRIAGIVSNMTAYLEGTPYPGNLPLPEHLLPTLG